MKTSATIFSALLVIGVLILAGCDNGKSGGGSTNGLVCQAGTAYVPQFNGCYSTNACQPGFAYVPQVNQCYPTSTTTNPGGFYPGSTTFSWSGQLSVSDHGLYRRMLADAGICDTYMWNWGYADCDNWPANGTVRLQSQSLEFNTRGTVFITPVYSSMWGSTSSVIPFSELLRPVNNNSQFELRTMGFWQGYDAVFSATGSAPLKETNGQPRQQLQLNLTYRGGALGTAWITYSQNYWY